jgi:hypothetical protein
LNYRNYQKHHKLIITAQLEDRSSILLTLNIMKSLSPKKRRERRKERRREKRKERSKETK